MTVEAESDLAKASDPAAWRSSQVGESVQISCIEGRVLDPRRLEFRLRGGSAGSPGVSTALMGHP